MLSRGIFSVQLRLGHEAEVHCMLDWLEPCSGSCWRAEEISFSEGSVQGAALHSAYTGVLRRTHGAVCCSGSSGGPGTTQCSCTETCADTRNLGVLKSLVLLN